MGAPSVKPKAKVAGRSNVVAMQPVGSSSKEREYVTTSEAAELLHVRSPNTVKNWLEGGAFPGSFQTPGGHWRLPRAEVLAVVERGKLVQARNAAGDMSLPLEDYDEEPPLL